MPDASLLAPLPGAVAAAAAILAACVAVGHAAIPARLRPPRSSHRVLADASVGATVVAWVTWVVGATAGTAAVLPAVAALVAAAAWRRRGLGGDLRRAARHLAALARAGGLATVTLVAVAAALAVPLLLPPCDTDGLRYHLALPKLYLLLGKVAHEPFGLGSTYPQHGEMLYLLGLRLADGQTAKLLHAAFFALALAALAVAVHRGRRTRAAAALAALLLAAAPAAAVVAGTAFVDHVALFHLGVAVALASRRGAPPLVGAALAGALATKLTAAPAALALAAWVVATAPPGRRLRAALALAVPAAVALGPLAARNVALTGDPVYPVGHVLLGIPAPGLTEAAVRYTTHFAGGAAGPLGIAWGPGMGGGRADDVAGWHHLLGLLAVAAAVRVRAARALAAPVAAGLLTAAAVHPPTRLLLPLLWGLAGLEAIALAAGRRRAWLLLGVAAAAPAAAVSIHALLGGAGALDALAGGVDREAFLARAVPGYAATRVVNAQPPGGRVMALDFPAPYYFDRPWIVEGMLCDPPLLLWLREARSASELLDRLRALDVRWLVVTPGFGGGTPASLLALAETPAQAALLAEVRAALRRVASVEGCDVYAVPPRG